MIRNPAIGQQVTVIVPGKFEGHQAEIVKQHKRSSQQTVGLKFDDHPWQRARPDSVWWFNVRELDALPQ